MLDQSPADGVPLPAKEVPRDRVLIDDELARVIIAARHAGIVEMLALTGQRREEVARCTWDEIDMARQTWKLSSERTKNAKTHEVYLSDQAVAVLSRSKRTGEFVFFRSG
ncbi:tyrosine-type recombinase/integrase, partial [Bradyrhizobium sp.]|uniref:tyrosine-type recombinase/integrase n=1 Tax=Bradyrhizobium sp. TaxID=376 RepID=UPI003BB10B10